MGGLMPTSGDNKGPQIRISAETLLCDAAYAISAVYISVYIFSAAGNWLIRDDERRHPGGRFF